MLDISLPRYQQGIQDAVNDPRNLLFLFHSQISLGVGWGTPEGGGQGVF